MADVLTGCALNTRGRAIRQQTIVVKQDEVTHLNQDGARLVAELSHTRRALQEARESSRRQAQKFEALQPIEQRNGVLAAQIVDKATHAQALQEQLTAALDQAGSLSTQVRDLELALAQSQAKYEAQHGIVAELRTSWPARPTASLQLG